MLIGQPFASFDERFSEDVHREVDRTSVGIAHETFVRISSHMIGKRRVAVIVERAKRLVFLHLQSEPLRHSLNGEGTEFVEFVSFH